MAFGLPVEGEDGPFAGEAVVDVPTCAPQEKLSEVLERLHDAGAEDAVVVNRQGAVLGLVDLAAIERSGADATVLEAMRVVPTTVRPSVLVSSLLDGEAQSALVTTPDGRLMGMVRPEPPADDRPAGMQELEAEFHDTVFALERHFGDREPTEEEVLAFLRDRLIAEGRSPEEADEFLAAMQEGS